MKTKTFILLLISAFTLFSCNNGNESNTNPPESEEDKIVNELIAQCKDFSAEDIAQGLPGEWSEDSAIIYDEQWQNIEHYSQFMGKWYVMGGALVTYIFTADGKGTYTLSDDFTISITATVEWQYDAEKSELSITREVTEGDYAGTSYDKFKITGYNGEYLVCDYVENNKYYRRIFKKRQE